MSTDVLSSPSFSVKAPDVPQTELLPALVQELEEIFHSVDTSLSHCSEEATAAILGKLAKYSKASQKTDGAEPRDWEQYKYFNDIHYTRNLVAKSAKFEVIVLCWKQGQASRIHTHSGSQCWMTILDGAVEEEIYTLAHPGAKVSDLPFPGPCPELVQKSHHVHRVGQVTYIHDGLGLHRVKAPENLDGITLHVYSPPITESRILDPSANTTSTRIPGYFTKYGKKVCRVVEEFLNSWLVRVSVVLLGVVGMVESPENKDRCGVLVPNRILALLLLLLEFIRDLREDNISEFVPNRDEV